MSGVITPGRCESSRHRAEAIRARARLRQGMPSPTHAPAPAPRCSKNMRPWPTKDAEGKGGQCGGAWDYGMMSFKAGAGSLHGKKRLSFKVGRGRGRGAGQRGERGEGHGGLGQGGWGARGEGVRADAAPWTTARR